MSASQEIALSIVMVTPDRYDRLRKTIEHLRRQTAKNRIEIVIAAPSLRELQPDHGELSDFASLRLVEVGPIRSTGEPRAIATRAATGPVIAYAEDHCWPEPNWAAALIDAHQESWGGVGATLTNGNAGSLVSWAAILLNFGPCVDCRSSGAAGYIPTHNSSYKADLLNCYGEQLGFMLQAEGLLQADLLKKGHRLFLQAEARAAHINASDRSSFLREQYWATRLFWASRAEWEQWSVARRWAWAVATPGLVLVRLQRALRNAHRIGFPARRIPALACALVAGIISLTFGAACGILKGFGRQSVERRISLEFHRASHLRPEERGLLPSD
jgi:hypothetical protein